MFCGCLVKGSGVSTPKQYLDLSFAAPKPLTSDESREKNHPFLVLKGSSNAERFKTFPRNVFFLNCAVHAPAMYGAVEALWHQFATPSLHQNTKRERKGLLGKVAQELAPLSRPKVFSKASLGAYKDLHARCEQSLPFWSWGEDRQDLHSSLQVVSTFFASVASVSYLRVTCLFAHFGQRALEEVHARVPEDVGGNLAFASGVRSFNGLI